MLSPRTMSLQVKSRTLMKALDRCTQICPKASLESSADDSEETSAVYRKADDSHLSAAPAPAQPSSLDMKSSSTTIVEEMKFRKTWETTVSNDKCCIKKKFKKVNTETGRCKSLCIDQQRLAEAQMHAPTHSHSSSKCYCTDNNNVRAQPDGRNAIQLYTLKQRIPSRLKKQRYRSDITSRHFRMVRWADHPEISHCSSSFNDGTSISQPQDATEMTKNPTKSLQTHSSRYSSASSLQQESHSSLFDRVKTFRECHWYDCHASPKEGSIFPDHECIQHYVLNKRLFLEPLYKDDEGKDSCPVCTLSSDDHHSEKACLKSTKIHRSSRIIITLPTVVLEPELLHTKSLESPSSGQKGYPGLKPKSCFLVNHHRTLADGTHPTVTYSYPRDSLALKYQKKA